MFPQVTVVTQATMDNWRHLTAVARAYYRHPEVETRRFADTIRAISRGGDSIRGGTGAEVAMFGAQQISVLTEGEGGWGYFLEHLDAESDQTRQALTACATGHFDDFQRLVSTYERTDMRALQEILASLAGIAAMADPDGTRPAGLLLDGTDTEPWHVNPRTIPEWRRQLVTRLEAPETPETTARGLREGHFALVPMLDDVRDAGRVLCEQEAARLRAARLYHVDADMSAVATRKAVRPRRTPLTALRVPCSDGLVIFAEPIDYAPSRAPLVAASWSRWTPTDPMWCTPTDDGLQPIHDDGTAMWWITLYQQQPGTPGMTSLGVAHIAEDQVFDQAPKIDTTEVAVRAVIACWDLITQERVGKAVTETTEERRKPVRARADRRRGITDDGTVRLVTIRGRRSKPPAPHRADKDSGSPGRRYDRGRWWVTEHTRSHCMNPAEHSDGGCTHEDITILEYPKGPEGTPFLDTVNLLRARPHQPGAWNAPPRRAGQRHEERLRPRPRLIVDAVT